MVVFLNTAEQLSTVVIAFYVASIGTLQWRTAREKFRFDLYMRRIEVYTSTMAYMQTVIAAAPALADTEWKERPAFVRALFESHFLFCDNPKIATLIDEFNTRSFKILNYQSERYRHRDITVALPGATEREEQYRSHIKWILAAREDLREMLQPYLAFSQEGLSRHKLRRQKKSKHANQPK